MDTGPLVAYINLKDPEHARVAEALDAFHGRLLSTAAVITEAMHFLAKIRSGPDVLADLLSSGGIVVVDVFQPSDLRAAARLMGRYHDTPMDFADATLVVAGEALGVLDILTLDRRGFSTFRTREGKSFRLVLESV
ncbi:MAG: PIN domain-containing protein [Longimicrobiales bacterium]